MQLINFTTTVSIPQTSQLKFKISCWHSNFHRNNFIQASLYSSGVYEPPIITKRLIKILSCPYGSSFIKPLSSSCNFNVKKKKRFNEMWHQIAWVSEEMCRMRMIIFNFKRKDKRIKRINRLLTIENSRLINKTMSKLWPLESTKTPLEKLNKVMRAKKGSDKNFGKNSQQN